MQIFGAFFEKDLLLNRKVVLMMFACLLIGPLFFKIVASQKGPVAVLGFSAALCLFGPQLLAQTIVTAERLKGTMSLLLSLPVRRRDIVGLKMLEVATLSILVVAAAFLGLVLAGIPMTTCEEFAALALPAAIIMSSLASAGAFIVPPKMSQLFLSIVIMALVVVVGSVRGSVLLAFFIRLTPLTISVAVVGLSIAAYSLAAWLWEAKLVAELR